MLSQRGKPLLVHDGHSFGIQYIRKDKKYWQCNLSRKFNCKARVTTTETGEIIVTNNEHCHTEIRQHLRKDYKHQNAVAAATAAAAAAASAAASASTAATATTSSAVPAAHSDAALMLAATKIDDIGYAMRHSSGSFSCVPSASSPSAQVDHEANRLLLEQRQHQLLAACQAAAAAAAAANAAAAGGAGSAVGAADGGSNMAQPPAAHQMHSIHPGWKFKNEMV